MSKKTYAVVNDGGNHIGVITNFDMVSDHYNTIIDMISDHYGLDEPLVEIKIVPDVKGMLSFTYSDASDGYEFTSIGILILEETVIYP